MNVMLALWAHGYLRIDNVPWDNGQWYEQNPYSKIVDVEEFYTDSLSLSYQKKHYRYMIARWGYSRALGTWEIINEMHGTTGWVVNPATAKQWVETVHAYFKQHDPFNRPTTASFGGIEGASHYTGSDQLGDMPNVHFYELHGWPDPHPDNVVRSGLANVVNEARKLKSKGDRPAFFGEAGWDHMLAAPETDAYTWEFHNAFWAGLATGLASTPFWWEFNSTDIFTQTRLQQYKILDQFVSDLDLAHLYYEPAEIHGANLDGYFMGADTTGFGWLETYRDTSVSNTPIYLHGTNLDNGTYRFEWFNTWTGNTLGSDSAVCVEGITWGTATDSIDRKDIAFRFQKLEDGAAASKVQLFLVKKDTLVAGTWPWSPKVDSTMYGIVCYVTDDRNRMDVTFNGPVSVEIEVEGETATDPFSIDLRQGGTVFDYLPSGTAGATVTAILDGIGSVTLYIPGLTAVPERYGERLPHGPLLLYNYPNPFRESTTIGYVLPERSRVRLAVYNMQGELVEILVDEQKSAGKHSTVWHPEKYPAGVYFYTLVSGPSSLTRKCIILRK
jgi:hypothetical protein